MGGDNSTTTTQTSGMNNKQLNAAVSTIGSQLNTQLGKGVKGYTESMVPALSSQTQAGIGALSNNPNNAAYGQGITDAINQQSQIAAGNFGNDPVRQRLMQDVSQNVNSSFLTDGRFGSMGAGAHSDTLAQETAGALAPYDMQRQQQAIQNLPGLYSASNMPAAANLQAGQVMDAYNSASAQDRARIFDLQNNAGWNTLERAGGILGTTAGAAGTTGTTTQTQNTPWWQTPLQIGGSIFGAMF